MAKKTRDPNQEREIRAFMAVLKGPDRSGLKGSLRKMLDADFWTWRRFRARLGLTLLNERHTRESRRASS